MNYVPQGNQIRFSAYVGDSLIFQTEWFQEHSPVDAPRILSEVRKQHGGDYAYRIERTGDSKTPNPVPMVRFQIKIGEVVFLSKIVPESEKDDLLATLKSGEDIERLKGELGLKDLKSFEAAVITEVKL